MGDESHNLSSVRCRPIASLDHFTAENLVSVDLIEEQQVGVSKYIKFIGAATQGRTVSLILRGSNKLMLEEADRSLHDALCVIKCLVKKKYLIAGGGAPGENLQILFCTTAFIYKLVTRCQT